MLLSNNVLYLTSEERIFLMHETIFAEPVGANRNHSTKGGGNVTAQRRCRRAPWLIA